MRYCCPPGAAIGYKLTPRDANDEAVFIPHTELAPDTLRRLVESFILREGTDYGEREVSLRQKLAQVYRQLDRGEARIVFDPGSQSVDIIVVNPSAR